MKYFYITLLFFTFIACEDVIELPLEEGPKRLVVDANINWEKGTLGNQQAIKLTETTGYYETSVPAASGATVTLTNSIDVDFPFIEDGNTGVYKTAAFIPVIDETYTLKIIYNNEVFFAEETLKSVASIEDIEQSTETIFGKEILKIEYYYLDPEAEENFYVYQFKYPSYIVHYYGTRSDEFSNGQLNSVFELDENLEPGNTLLLYFFGASKSYFNYFNLLLEQVESGGPFATPPASVTGNCINLTNPDTKPLGYFRLSEMVIAPYLIKDFE